MSIILVLTWSYSPYFLLHRDFLLLLTISVILVWNIIKSKTLLKTKDSYKTPSTWSYAAKDFNLHPLVMLTDLYLAYTLAGCVTFISVQMCFWGRNCKKMYLFIAKVLKAVKVWTLSECWGFLSNTVGSLSHNYKAPWGHFTNDI